MKKTLLFLFALSLGALPMAQAQTLEEKVAKLEDKLAEMEANNSTNIFKFSGTSVTRYDVLSTESKTPAVVNEGYLPYLRSRFSINAEADFNQYITMHSRFTTTKFFNKWRSTGNLSTYASDTGGSDSYQDSNVTLETGYLDIKFPSLSSVLSIGRIPTSDGPPAHYWDGLDRQGTYPLLAFGGTLDAIAWSVNLASLMPQNQSLSVRLIAAPFSDLNLGGSGIPAYMRSPNQDTLTGLGVQTTKQHYNLNADYSVKNLSYVDSINLIYQLNYIDQLNYSSSTGSGSTLSVNNRNIQSVYLDFNNILQSNVYLALAHLWTGFDSKGLASAGKGYATSKAEDTITGSFSLASASYRLSNWIFGYEYGSGTEGVIYGGNNLEDLSKMYGFPGTLNHAYVTYRFYGSAAFRVGSYTQNYTHTANAIGPISQTDNKVNASYAQLRVDF